MGSEFSMNSYEHDQDSEDECNYDYKDGFSLHDAAFDGNCERITELLNKGHDVDNCNNKQETPVFVAASNAQDEALKMLLDNGANADLYNKDEISPLLKAIKCSHLDCATILLENNADADYGDAMEWAPLHEACYKDVPSLVEQLIKIGQAGPNVQNEDGVSPLFTACQYGNSQCVKVLLQYGAKCDIVTVHGDSPLHIACQEGHLDCAKLLIDDGFDVNWRNHADISPLAIACLLDEYDCAEFLIDSGADIEPSIDDTNVESPLHIAAQHKDSVCLSLLVSSDVNVNTVCDDITPLFEAASFDNDQNCRELILAGADPNCECIPNNDLTYTPLMITAQDDYVDTMGELVSGGANVNHATFTSPLILAVRSQSFACFKFLLDCDVDVNFVDCGKNTALSTICGVLLLRRNLTVLSIPLELTQVTYMSLLDNCRNLLQAGAHISRLFQSDVYSHVMDLPLIYSHPKLMKLLLEFDGTRKETRKICELNCAHKDWKPLWDIVRLPRKLEHLCRLVIRQTLGYKRLKHIDDLPVPNNLKNYLSHIMED